ncbi:hypothetical protein O4H49_13095 [Kiloniella laminariae]|uniref:Uncharacterized protein n=1 Tax=Kiloniella laminariae TaxID=454162 RepID=A0ABT4LKV3_9PROT|nr:hypothetical protein [Kiloniella laminariae]MCZ4281720.1 hypothetical protein [Kiloniella laminariae]
MSDNNDEILLQLKKDKKEKQFMTICQTIFTVNAITLSVDDKDLKLRHLYSATGIMGMMSDALEASVKIPKNMCAAEAAHQFCFYFLDNLRDPESMIPLWCMKY